ncbi:MAG: phosphotyrosine protein phosphatase [Bacteroidota bacterium]
MMEQSGKTYLFVCLANMNRSPTAATVFQELVQRKGLDVHVMSAGISGWAARPLNTDVLKKADLIFVMEGYMKYEIESIFSVEPGKIIVLGIPDNYDRNDPVLVKILRETLEPYIE